MQPFVPPPGTRKKSVPLFDLSCSTTKNALSPYKIKTFTTEWNNWNKWNNKNKK